MILPKIRFTNKAMEITILDFINEPICWLSLAVKN